MLSEDELVLLLREGDETAFRDLVNRYGDRVYNTILPVVQNLEDAEDLSQDTFIKVFQSVKNFEGNSAFSTWLYRIAVNISLDHLRKQKRQKRFGGIFSLSRDLQVGETKDFNHPGVRAEEKENARILFAALRKIPEKQRIAFSLKKAEGLSYREIAEILGTTEAAVDSLIQRAAKNLRVIIDKNSLF